MLSPPNNTAIFKRPNLCLRSPRLYSNVSAAFANERSFLAGIYSPPEESNQRGESMRSIRRLTLVSLAAVVFIGGCEGGSSDEPQPITFTPAAAPAGTGFVAMYAPPVDNVPYPNDIYFNPTTGRLNVPVKVTSPLSAALNTLDGFSTTAVISAPFNA